MIWLMEWDLTVEYIYILSLSAFSLHVLQVDEKSWGKELGIKEKGTYGMERKKREERKITLQEQKFVDKMDAAFCPYALHFSAKSKIGYRKVETY